MNLCKNCIFYDICEENESVCVYFYNKYMDSLKENGEYSIIMDENKENYTEVYEEYELYE